MLKRLTVQMFWSKTCLNRQTLQMLCVRHVSKTNSTNVVKWNMFKRQTVQMLWVKTCLKDKQYKCREENMSKRQILQMLWVKRA